MAGVLAFSGQHQDGSCSVCAQWQGSSVCWSHSTLYSGCYSQLSWSLKLNCLAFPKNLWGTLQPLTSSFCCCLDLLEWLLLFQPQNPDTESFLRLEFCSFKYPCWRRHTFFCFCCCVFLILFLGFVIFANKCLVHLPLCTYLYNPVRF